MHEIRWERNAVGMLMEVGERNRARIVQQVAHLRRFPRLGTALIGPLAGLRRLVVGPYSVVYGLDDEKGVVSIVALVPGGWVAR